ncbi:phage head morphogenesis protein [Lactiplantibacillus mudanjiangensis]|uniref:Phage Mu protein F like protein [Lactobacillus parabuchneri] n=1 Tax=Lactiplantibacillus mudanjiangensis TaxID=1296538 RepID=A0A660DX76_9LACO|nr:phage minor head protein [Lactiplantibacillus mudanjiangensis]VDG23676.1 Phage Mu protein F like protein [Lactobacillus parabuchneri] [Lactiplantibacillus mudanjiangensis]VDG27819.1 Phage Mu protein F like protein [Lactobacillus parabuchneri] [Lactiplantibacillus mudanjiangensis]
MRKVIPHVRYPWKLEQSYVRLLAKQQCEYRRYFMDRYHTELVPVVNNSKLVTDADQPAGMLNAILQPLIITLGAKMLFDQQVSESDVKKWIAAVGFYNLAQINTQLRARGRPTLGPEINTAEIQQSKWEEEAIYLKSLDSDLLNNLRAAVIRGINNGANSKQIEQALMKQFDLAQNRANLIAQNETGSFFAALSKQRYQRTGSSKYVWQTQEDERVRPSHQELDQSVRKYSDDPFPGEPIRCRCVADPIYEEDEEE